MAGKAKKVKAPKVKKEKVPGVGDLAVELIRGGKDNEEVLAAVQKKFPKSSVSASSIAWYRNKLRSDGEKSVKTAREIKKARKKASEKK